jgi:hypothetical protein
MKPWFCVVSMLAVIGMTTGCDDDCGDCHDKTVVVETPCCGNVYPYRLDVRVQDTLGYTLGGASVELIIATVPEQRYISTTRSDGIAVFYFEAPPDVVAIAYACAPGYECNAADIGTTPAYAELFLNVVLRF